jgi:hypothetical protein
MALIRLPAWPNGKQWARTAWVSAEAKAVWAPRISQINKALSVMELESVYSGVRPSALVFKTPEELVELTKEALKRGCTAFVLSVEGATSASYASGSTQYVPGKAFRFRTIVTKDPAPWVAHANNDELGIGELLGYPKCCSEFYKRTWVDEAWRDSTYPMSLGGAEGPVEANILLRWLGIRFVRHLPCSFTCEETVRVGKENEALGISLGFTQEMAWMRELLSWNVQWSSLHGVAEITTPCFKISTNTDPLAEKVVVQKVGTSYPDEGATGLDFPFEPPGRKKTSDTRSFAAAMQQQMLSITSKTDWEDNGFSSKEAMEASHGPLVNLLAKHKPRIETIMDLGCGNGVLVEKLCGLYEEDMAGSAPAPHGVELDAKRLARAHRRMYWGVWTLGNIKDTELWDTQPYDLVVLMPGRLQEMASDERARVLASVQKAKYVLMYAYGDWIKSANFQALNTHFSIVDAVSTNNVLASLYVSKAL